MRGSRASSTTLASTWLSHAGTALDLIEKAPAFRPAVVVVDSTSSVITMQDKNLSVLPLDIRTRLSLDPWFEGSGSDHSITREIEVTP